LTAAGPRSCFNGFNCRISPTAYTFTLDALGRPVTRSGGAATLSYAYVGTGTTAWRQVTGAATVDAGLGPDESRVALKSSSTFDWLLPDLLGNIAAGINSAETAVTDAWRYDGYGRKAASTTTGVTNPWKYQGRLDIGNDANNPFYAAGAPPPGSSRWISSRAGRGESPRSGAARRPQPGP
jgi:hypothetical protein